LTSELTSKNVIELFQHQLEIHPDKLALIQTDDRGELVRRLTYRELSIWVEQIAERLAGSQVEAGQSVAIEARHSAATIAAMLACARIGVVYVPLDFTYPQERLEFMLTDTAARLVLCTSDMSECQLDVSIQRESIGEPSAKTSLVSAGSVISNDSLYIMYTSGSTGRPKGAEVRHSGVIRLVDPANSYIQFSENTNFLQLSPLTFDASTLEIWGPLLNGGTCVIYDFKHLPDPEVMSKVIKDYGVTSLWLTASYFNWVIDNKMLSPDLGLKEILTGGEALSVPHMRKAQALLPQVQFVNGYGPTETTTFACCYRIPRPIPDDWSAIPIGYAIHNTQVYVVDDKLTPVKPGTQGELLIAGDGVAKDYRNLPEQTKEKFVECKIGNKKFRAYRTGDFVQADEDGLIHYIGRVDDQVKIAGHRIELGEVSAQLLAINAVQAAHAQVEFNPFGDKVLVAYVVTTGGANKEALKSEMAQHVPKYMVPAEVVFLDSLPLNQNGKVDRAALPKAFATQTKPGASVDWEAGLKNLWCEVLGVASVREQDNFFDQGGNSLLYMRMVTLARAQLPVKLTAVDIFEAPTFGGLKKLLTERQDQLQIEPVLQVETRDIAEAADQEIAIIGMSGRFPGANNVDTFWQNLLDGKESITHFEFSELEPLAQAEARENADYVYARGIVDEYDCFDAAFFGVSHLEAEISDPQQRVFLEEIWKAMEHAGYAPSEDLRIGVFAGSGHNGYYLHHVIPKYGVDGPLGALPTQFVNDKDYIATRAAFKLNLKGPCLSINTACSTSLVTTVEAVKSLRAGECDIALSGGVSFQTPMLGGYLYQEGGMLSRDGSTRPFEKDSSGTTFNSGAAVVVLKRLRDAIKDGDTVYAVIRGIGLNNDGAGKASFTAPSVHGQAEVVKAAIRDAGCSPEDISYVETHGTATPLGDPIELEALARAFGDLATRKERNASCLIGSVKSNVGHLVSAAGATGLIKTALALKHGKLPATLHYHAPNPHIDFAHMPFKVCAEKQEWHATDNHPIFAGVSSFGVGGTNAHVVVTQPPAPAERAHDLRAQLIPVSAKDPEVAANYLANISSAVAGLGEDQLADAAFTTQQSRSHLTYRTFTVAAIRDHAIALGPVASVKQVPDKIPQVLFMFPGQGAQTINMGRQLYFNQSVFRQAFDQCADLFEPLIGLDLRDLIFTEPDNEKHKALLAETRYTQPAIFANEYALAQLWMALGIKPAAMIGHSIGEYSAAAVAGMFSLADAVKLVAERAGLMFSMSPGSMLAVMADEATTQQYLAAGCEISVINGPQATVVSGPDVALTKMASALEAAEIKSRLLETSHAFHSASMQPAADAFLQVINSITIKPATIPIISTKTSGVVHDMATAMYWAEQIRQPVRFYNAVASLEDKNYLLLEVGPGRSLFNNTRTIPQPRVGCGIDGSEEEYQNWLKAIGSLWQEGVSVDWAALHAGYQPRRIPLPTYPFKRNRYWIEAAVSNSVSQAPVDFNQGNLANLFPLPNPVPAPAVVTEPGIANTGNSMSIKDQLVNSLKSIFADLSGEDFASVSGDTSFLDLGMDSLVLTQIALKLKNQYKLDIPFRRLMQDLDNFELLGQFIADNADASKLPQATAAPAAAAQAAPVANMTSMQNAMPATMVMNPPGGLTMHTLIAQQLQLINQQLMLMSQGAVTPGPVAMPAAPAPMATPAPAQVTAAPTKEKKQAFGAQTRINLDKKEISFTDEQLAQINAVMQEYIEKTKSSKAYAQQHRSILSDPRTASGFSPELKEIVYPIVVNKSKGARFWDLDGNEYIDTLCGYGSNFLGYSPDFVIEAMKAQLDQGIEIGPQHPLAGELAELLADTIPLDRFAFCNTGSEAVLGAIRMARTASGRKTMVMFNGAYHGITDEVIVRPGPDRMGRPAAAGIVAEAASNMMILEYGDPESLKIIRDNADDIAGVLIESVQSRNPALQPREFLQELRKLTEEHEIAFIMDEVITGFRVGLGGAQEHFGVKADLATYGKVIGGGISIGIIGGSRKYMDTLDGGAWQFGDDSAPEVGVTYFAGTFVRHPLALASAMAVLKYLREQGNQLQQGVTQKAEDFTRDMNLVFKYNNLPMEIGQFSSLMYLKLKEEVPYIDVMFADMRCQGIHIYPGRPMFFTTAHTDADIDAIKQAFLSSIERMQAIGVFKSTTPGLSAERN